MSTHALALLGLAGLVDNVIEWHGFFGNIVTEYQSVRGFFFEFLSLDLEGFIEDSIVVGIATLAAWKITEKEVAKKEGMSDFSELSYLPLTKKDVEDLGVGSNSRVEKIAIYFGVVACWPLVWVTQIWNVYLFSKFQEPNIRKYRVVPLHFVKSTLVVLVYLIGLLFLSSDALSKLTGG